jgi:hypothetical protein
VEGGGGGGWTGVHCRSRMRDWRVFAFVGLEGGVVLIFPGRSRGSPDKTGCDPWGSCFVFGIFLGVSLEPRDPLRARH